MMFDELDQYRIHIVLPVQRDHSLLSQKNLQNQQNLNKFISRIDSQAQPPPGIPVGVIREVEAQFELSLTTSAIQSPLRRSSQLGLPHDGLAEYDLDKVDSISQFLLNAEPISCLDFNYDWISLDNDSPFSSQETTASSLSDGPSDLLMQSCVRLPEKIFHCYISLFESGFQKFLCSGFQPATQKFAEKLRSQVNLVPRVLDPGYHIVSTS